jgi:hypothetical protein
MNSRKINTLGKTHKLMAWVTIFAPDILSRYDMRLLPCAVKANIKRPMITGRKTPEIIPEIRLSYFSTNFIS